MTDAPDDPVRQRGVLASPEGQRLLDRLARERHGPDALLGLTSALRRDYPPAVVSAALTQHGLRTAGSAK